MRKRRIITFSNILVIIIIIQSLGFPGKYTLIIGDVFNDVFNYGCAILELLLMFKYSKAKIIINKEYIFAILFMAIVFIESMLVTNFPMEELISCTRFLITIIFALWLSRNLTGRQLLELICLAQLVFIILTLLFTLLKPGEAFSNSFYIGRAFNGLYSTKNACGSELACGIVLYIAYIHLLWKEEHTIKPKYIVFLVVQVLLLLMCLSIGALLTAILTVIVVTFFGKKRVNPALFMWTLSIIYIGVSLTGILDYLNKYFVILGKTTDMTGRTVIWDRVIDVMMHNHTFTGFGFSMFWRDPSAYRLIHAGFNENTFMGSMTYGAHNFLLEFWLNVGIFGIVALAVLMFYSMRRIKEAPYDYYLFIFTYVAFFTIHGFTERAMGSGDYSTLLMFLSIGSALSFNAYDRKNRSAIDLRIHST